MVPVEEVHQLAHQLWVEDGMPLGRDLDHWLRAEELLSEGGASQPAAPASPPETAAPGATRPAERNLLAVASFLGQSRLFGVIPLDELRALAADTEPFRFDDGTVIFREDEPADRLFMIRAGTVKVVRHGPDGAELRLATLHPGDVFGELSLMDGKPRSATTVALEAVEGITLSQQRFVAFLRTRPDAALCVMRVLAARLRQANDALQEAAFADNPD